MKKRKYSIALLTLLVIISLVTSIGCGKKENASTSESKTTDAKPVVIGVPTSLGTSEGADSLRAVELAVDEVNKNGGVTVKGEKHPLKVVSIDTRESEPGVPVTDALAALEKLITQEKPDAMLVGAFRSEVMLSAMDLIAKYKTPNIVTIAMSPEFEKKFATNYDNYKYNFRLGFTSKYLVGYIADTMDYVNKQYGLKKVYVINQDVLWAQGTAAGLEKVLKSKGFEVIGKDAYPTGASDFSASLTKAKKGGAEIMVLLFDMPQSGILLKQAKSMQVPALMLGYITAATSENGGKTLGEAVDGFINFNYEIGPIPVAAVPKSVAFNENFGKKYGEEARAKLGGHGPGPAYDSVYALVAAIERADSLESDAIVAALEKTDMEGAIGRIKFSDKHQAVFGYNPKETAVGTAFQWINGKRVPVFPETLAEGKIQLPSFVKK